MHFLSIFNKLCKIVMELFMCVKGIAKIIENFLFFPSVQTYHTQYFVRLRYTYLKKCCSAFYSFFVPLSFFDFRGDTKIYKNNYSSITAAHAQNNHNNKCSFYCCNNNKWRKKSHVSKIALGGKFQARHASI